MKRRASRQGKKTNAKATAKAKGAKPRKAASGIGSVHKSSVLEPALVNAAVFSGILPATTST
jgi:hypothetical protein